MIGFFIMVSWTSIIIKVVADEIGSFRVDDEGHAYVDGVHKGRTRFWDQIREFTAPDDWQILGIHGINTRKLAMIGATLGPYTYTNTCLWKCSDTYQPGWATAGFNDSGWVDAAWVDYYGAPYGPGHGPNMDPRMDHIWFPVLVGVQDIYCRTERLKICDVGSATYDDGQTRDITFERIDPNFQCMAMRNIGTYYTGGPDDCATMCLSNVTSCRHTTEVMCVPPFDGCCGYLYDERAMTCDLYTRDPPHPKGEKPVREPIHNNWVFFHIK